ncbi:GNAT family N-acetyltransferase [Rufibacter immobilis]|uniref:GNAT family N-acetyltransferase n=1 Tax=Rufibacter immobilis TaxID=1348778 RepID=UPI001C83F083|nr:GNAT family N-acetyltransferase [Rufibacter immobilis]
MKWTSLLLSFSPIKDTATPDFVQAWQLYEEAFPEEERRSLEQQRTLLPCPNYSFEAISLDGEICGIIGYWQQPGFLFLEHFAVDARKRGTGIGSQALGQFLQGKQQPVVLEVEPPTDQLTQRRVEFYTRAGFCLNEFSYRQPPYSPEKPWVPLQLMTFPAALSPVAFEQVRSQLYQVVYQQA